MATYTAAAEVVAPIVARWNHGSACYRLSANRAFEHTGLGPDFSIQHIQDNHLSEALCRYPDTITKETPWKQAIRHHSHNLAREILPFLERSQTSCKSRALKHMVMCQLSYIQLKHIRMFRMFIQLHQAVPSDSSEGSQRCTLRKRYETSPESRSDP